MATATPPATSAPATPAAAQTPSAAPSAPAGGAAPSRSEAEFLAGAAGPADALFAGEQPAEAPPEGGEPAEAPESPDAILDEIEQTLPDDAKAAFKARIDQLKTEAGRVKALAGERRQAADVAKHNYQAGQGAMQIAGMAIQRLRAAGLDASDLESYLGGGQVSPGQAGGETDAGGDGQSGEFDFMGVARESIDSGLSDSYWKQYDAAIGEVEAAMETARDLVEANHPKGQAQLEAAIARRREIDRIHARQIAAVSAHPSRAVYETLSRRIAQLEAGRGEEADGEQFTQTVHSALREHVHDTDDLGKPMWREGGKFPFYSADGKKLAPLGQKMIGAMAAFWEKYQLDPSEPENFSDAFHFVAHKLGLQTTQQAAPQSAADGRRGGGDPTLPGGASIPVAAVGRSPFQTPESRRQAILEQNRRGMRETG